MTGNDTLRQIWFLRLADRLPVPPILIALAVFAILIVPWVPLLIDLLVFSEQALTSRDLRRVGLAFFLPIEIAYAIWVGIFILRRTLDDIDGMAPTLGYTADDHEAVRHSLTHHPRRRMLIAAALGAPAGVYLDYVGSGAINWIIHTGEFIASDLWVVVTAIILWITVFQLAAVLTRNSKIVSRLTIDHLQVDLLNVDMISGFSRGVIRNVLVFVLGTVTFPLLWLDGDIDLWRIVPGYIFILAVLSLMLIPPLASVHKRIVDAKRKELECVRRAMLGDRAALADSRLAGDADTIRMPELIAYKQVIEAVPDSPLETPAAVRLFFYVMIPPLAWSGAAIIERVIDTII